MIDCIIPDWPAPTQVNALFTTRQGGVSNNNNNGIYATLNLAMHVDDHPADVAQNRVLLQEFLPNEPKWLQQVHGATPIWTDQETVCPVGDAALSRKPKTVCAILVADCLPIFLCDTAGTTVGVVHAGWRGLVAGIIEQCIAAMQVDHDKLMAWLGPAIGPDCFEVGDEVRLAFVDHDPLAAQAFTATINHSGAVEKKWFADIFLLARQRLASAGVAEVYGGGICTYSDPERFFSYRRDGKTGRMAALIWLDEPR